MSDLLSYKFLLSEALRETNRVTGVGGLYWTSNGEVDYYVEVSSAVNLRFAQSKTRLNACGVYLLPDGSKLFSARIGKNEFVAKCSDFEHIGGNVSTIVSVFGISERISCIGDVWIKVYLSDADTMSVILRVVLESELERYDLGDFCVKLDGSVIFDGRPLEVESMRRTCAKALAIGRGVVIE